MTAPLRLALVVLDRTVDPATVEAVACAHAEGLGVDLTVHVGVGDGGVGDEGGVDGVVVLAPPGGARLDPAPASVPWVRADLAVTGPAAPADGLVAHVHGRGVDGAGWALRALTHHLRWPAERVAYGADIDQFGELRLPRDADRRVPVVMLVHGGFYRSKWSVDLMDALAIDLAGRGWASWNVEYRRPDRHGWDATVDDMTAALGQLHSIAGDAPIDLDRIVLVGHSAGGQLVVQLAADAASVGIRPAVVVPLASVADLAACADRDLGDGAVVSALGGTAAEVPGRYRAASPIGLVPLGIPQVVVTGRDDSADLNEMNRRYVAAARAGGDDVVELVGAGNHFTVIDPSSDVWSDTVAAVARFIDPTPRPPEEPTA